MAKIKKQGTVDKAGHSMNPYREAPRGTNMRTKSTIRRLNMYKNFKAKRDSKGKITKAAPFQSKLPSGTMSRIEPNRRWFGNTRVISQDSLQNFKEVMKVRNPYEVILRPTKLPITLLDEKKQKAKSQLLALQGYQYVFGKKAQRKKPTLNCDDLSTMVNEVETTHCKYDVGKDRSLVIDYDGVRDGVPDAHFKAGRSKRVWNELFKVLDSSDVILYVLDARDPLGTRSPYIENYLRTEKPHKHFIFVINKVDLVPVWITKRWKMLLSAIHPTLVFHAGNLTKPLGKNALLGLLRQLAQMHRKDKHQISVGIIGYPNVGKSSIINAMRSKKVCNVAPVAGETKVWQYVTLLKSIYLIDCPGVVYPDGATESELVMKGVVRIEYLHQPELYIGDVLARVKPEFMQHRFQLPPFVPPTAGVLPAVVTDFSYAGAMETVDSQDDCAKAVHTPAAVLALPVKLADENGDGKPVYPADAYWPSDPELFLELVAKKTGKLLKGGEPNIKATAKRVLNDFQRGRLPYFVRPPPLNEAELAKEKRDLERRQKHSHAKATISPKTDSDAAVSKASDDKATKQTVSTKADELDSIEKLFDVPMDTSDSESDEDEELISLQKKKQAADKADEDENDNALDTDSDHEVVPTTINLETDDDASGNEMDCVLPDSVAESADKDTLLARAARLADQRACERLKRRKSAQIAKEQATAKQIAAQRMTGKQRRQLERVARKEETRAGADFYQKVDIKNRGLKPNSVEAKKTFGGSASTKRGK